MARKKFNPEQKEEYYQDSYERIESLIPTIDVKPYSSNMITMRLRIVADKLGKEQANQLIDELGLEEYGWKKQ